MLDHHLQNGRHGKNVADAVRLDQPERFGDIEFLRRQQDGRHAARGLHELVHAGAMRQRRDHQRGIGLRRARHQVGEMICHHKGHLAVGEHRRLGAAGGAGGEEEPAGIVVIDRCVIDLGARMIGDHAAHGFFAKRPLADPPDEFQRGIGGRLGVIRKIAMAQKSLRAGGGGEIGDLVRHQAEIGRHPDRAEPKGREHRPEHLVAIFGMHQDAVALGDAPRGEARRQRGDVAVDLAPGPGSVAPDEARAVAMAAGILGQHMRQVHHPARHPRQAAARGGNSHGFSHRESTIRFEKQTWNTSSRR